MFCFDPAIDWSTIVQLLGFVGAIWAVFYQFKAQRRLQTENRKVELQLQTYEKVVANIEGASPTGVATTFDMVLLSLEKARDRLDQTGKYIPPPFGIEDIHTEFVKVHANLWRVVATIEKYEVVVPNLTLFREATAKKIRELGDSYVPVIQRLPYLLPSHNCTNNPSELIVFRGEEAMRFVELVERFGNVSYDIAGFLYDIQLELQNALLSPFFGQKLKPRLITEKNVLVLTSNDPIMMERIEKYVRE